MFAPLPKAQKTALSGVGPRRRAGGSLERLYPNGIRVKLLIDGRFRAFSAGNLNAKAAQIARRQTI